MSVYRTGSRRAWQALAVFYGALLLVSIPTLRSLGEGLEVRPESLAAGQSWRTRPKAPGSGEVIVKFSEKISQRKRSATLDSARGRVVSQIHGLNAVVVRVKAGEGIDGLSTRLRGHPKIEYVEPNYAISIRETDATDPYYNSSGTWGQAYDDMWGLKKINAGGAWDTSRGSSNTVVAVPDTGLDLEHEDIQGRVWRNSAETGRGRETNGIDDDRNGYVDDWAGWDFAANDNEPSDGHGHGTHVAGTIAAAADNGIGVAGINWSSRLMPLRVLDNNGLGTSADAAAAIIYAADNGAVVINASWSSPNASIAVQEAVEYAISKGAVVIAASGNDGADAGETYPGAWRGVVTVAATDERDRRSWFSNFGSVVDLSAPGQDILSLRAGGTGQGLPINSKYTRMNGTSMATAHATGVASLILGLRPAYLPAQVEHVLESTADDLGPSGWDSSFGHGRLNAARALAWLDSAIPVTGMKTDPGEPDGVGGWFRTPPKVTLTPNRPGTTHWQWDSTAIGGWQVFTKPIAALAGRHTLNFRSVDVSGMIETPLNKAELKVDSGRPTGSVTINGGAAFADSARVALSTKAADIGASGIELMRIRNSGGPWAGWTNYSARASWSLIAGDGAKRVYVQYMDGAGNLSQAYSDTITLDTVAPASAINSPWVSTRSSARRRFPLTWGEKRLTSGGQASDVDYYDIRYRPANSANWTDWLRRTQATAAVFIGSPGRTYYFRVRATDRAGHVGWSKLRRTVVPYDQDSLVRKRVGFVGRYDRPNSRYYLGTLRYSTTRGTSIAYKIRGDMAVLIGTKAKNRSRAKIYVDGRYRKTIDNFSRKTKHRQVFFVARWERPGTHYVKIVNLATPGRRVFDIDAVAVGR